MDDSNTAPTRSGSSLTSRASLVTMLIVANGATIAFYLLGHASILQVLWTYWAQSVLIGAVNVIRLITMGNNNVGIAQLRNTVAPALRPPIQISSKLSGWAMAAFFALHYGFFHVIYAYFLVTFSNPATSYGVGNSTYHGVFGQGLDVRIILGCAAAFAIHHGLSFLVERQQIRQHPEDFSFGVTFNQPYSRIIPMHLIIIVGPVLAVELGTGSVLIVFMVLKTIADVVLFVKGTSHPPTIPATMPRA